MRNARIARGASDYERNAASLLITAAATAAFATRAISVRKTDGATGIAFSRTCLAAEVNHYPLIDSLTR